MNSNGIITAPVTTTDVSTVLGTGSHSLSTLCTHSSINPYAKYKPVKYSNPTPDRNGNDKYWWRADDGLCGFTTQVCTSLNEVLDYMKSGSSYSYVPPSGGQNSAYRLADFNGYNHQVVKSFFEAPELSGEVGVNFTNNVYLTILQSASPDYGNDFISFNDLAPVSPTTGSNVVANDMYVAAHFISNSDNRQFTVMSTNTFGEMEGAVDMLIPLDESKLNTPWTYYVFLCEKNYIDFNMIFLPTDIPPTYVRFHHAVSEVEMYLSIRDIENENGLFTIAFENKTGSYFSNASVTCTLYDQSNMDELAFETIVANLELQNGESKTVNFSFFFDFDGYQNPDYESSYELEAKITVHGQGQANLTSVTFDRYPDGSWIQT